MKLFKIYSFIMVLFGLIIISKYNVLAADVVETSPRIPFVGSGEDDFHYPKPSDSMLKTHNGIMEIKVDSRELLPSAPNQWREDQVLARADRDRAHGWTYNVPIVSGGEATGYTTESSGPLDNPPNPNRTFTYGYTVYPSEYGLTKFTGYTFVTGSKMGVKRGSIFAEGEGNSIEFKRTGEHSGDIFRQDGWFVTKGWFSAARWGYLGTNSADGKPWGHVWDVWGEDKSWSEGGGSVTVTMAPDGSSAYIRRTYTLGANGYVNYPLYGGTIVEGGVSFNEWHQIYGTGKDPTNTNSNQFWDSEKVRERRWYGVGERLWFFGIKNVDLIAVQYVGTMSPVKGDTSLQTGLKVKSTFDTNLNNVEFKVELTGPVSRTMTFTRNIPRLSEANYSEILNCAALSAGNYTIRITVNPQHNNPSNEVSFDNNFKEHTFTIIEPPPPVVPTGNHMFFGAEIPDQVKYDKITSEDTYLINPSSYNGSVSAPLRIKAGYGIPIIAELQGFDYKEKTVLCSAASSYYSNFNITSLDVKITSTSNGYGNGLDGFWMDPNHSVSGIDTMDRVFSWIVPPLVNKEKARFALKQQTGKYPLGLRKVYTNPRQQDGLYVITVTATTNVQYTDNIPYHIECPGHPQYDSEGYYTYTLYHECSCGATAEGIGWIQQTKPNPPVAYTDKVDLYVRIDGSMFDDDQQIIKK